jgi:hypothetical protein
MNASILSLHPQHLNIAWAQKIVNQHSADTLVTDINILSVDIGTTTRVKLAVTHNGPVSLPARWFVKLPSLSWRARLITALPRLLPTEVRFYNEVSQTIPLAIPNCLAAESLPGISSTLVLADVEESQGNTGHPSDTLTVAQAALVIEELALLHSQFWGENGLKQSFPWLDGPVRRCEDRLGSTLAVPLMKHGLHRAGSLIPTQLHQDALRYAKNRRIAMRHLAKNVQTLIHHDCHPGNLFWQSGRPGLLDWQLVRMGEGISDVAYFLATALNPQTRKRHETELIAYYAQSLGMHGVTAPAVGDLMQHYCAHLVYAFEAMVVTLAVGGMMDADSNRELIRRTTAAVQDKRAFSELPNN